MGAGDFQQGYYELLEDLKDLAQIEAINTTSADQYEGDLIIGGPSALYELDRLYNHWTTTAHAAPDLFEMFNPTGLPQAA